MTTPEETMDVNVEEDGGTVDTGHISDAMEQQLLGENDENEKIDEHLSEVKEETVNNDVKTTEPFDDGEIKDTDDVEPGELPSLNEGNDDVGDMDVLEAILGDGDDTKDDFDKEIDANSTTAKKAATTKGKKTPKRKSTRKTKNTKKTENVPQVAAKEKTPPKPVEAVTKVEIDTNPTPDKVETSQKKVIATSETEVPTTIKKTKGKVSDKGKEKPVVTANTVAVANEEKETIATVKKTPVKGAKKKKTAVKSTVKKEAKKVEEPVNVIMDEEKPKETEQNEEALEKKVKELEKLVKLPPVKVDSAVKTEGDGKQKLKKEKVKVQGERKRKASEQNSSVKDMKTKKGKTKAEITGEVTAAAAAADGDEKLATDAVATEDLEDTMKVVDGFSDNESHYSGNGSSFTRSYSRSLSGSFSDGSFSVTLSSFSGSHSSLDSIGKELGEEKKKKKRRRKHVASAEKVLEHKEFIDNMLKGARYFIIKSNNYENVTLSKAKAVWATPPANERKLNDAYKHSTNVILVFSVKESGRFQGFARLASESRHDGIPVPWVLPPGFDRRILGGTFKVDWLNRKEVTFSKCANLRNPWNENKEVKICRDGQELEPSVGEVLCRMFEDDLTVDINRIDRHTKRHKSSGDNHRGERFRGGGGGSFRGEWRGRGGFRGGFRGGDRGRFNRRGGGSGGGGFRRRGGRFRDDRGSNRRPERQNDGLMDRRDRRPNANKFQRERSRSPDYRTSYDRDSRERRHKDRVKEFLKEDRSKYGIREETLLHGSYSDYVREFHRQKEIGGSHRSSHSSSSYYHGSSSNYPSSSGRHYDQNAASAEEFLRRTRR